MVNHPVVRRSFRPRAAAVLLLLAGTAAAAPSADTRAEVVIRGIRLVDVRRGVVAAAHDVVIRGTRIASVAPAGAVLPEAKTTIDGRGKFAVPGLIDAAVTLAQVSPDAAAELLIEGVTAVRDVGTSPARVAEWRRALAYGKIYSPRIARACPPSAATPAAEAGCGLPPGGTAPALAALLETRSRRLTGVATQPRLTLHDELEALVRARFTPAAALRAVTLDAAQALMTPELGDVAAGRAADIVVTTADPLRDIRNLRAIDAVVFRGEALTRAHLNLLRAGAAPGHGTWPRER